MGNCQAAEAATVVIQHPGNRVERIYCSVSARQVMRTNPGHYVALVLPSPALKSRNGAPVKQLKLLRPDDSLLIGQVYRLISVEEILKEFAAKKCVKLGKLLKERGVLVLEKKQGTAEPISNSDLDPHLGGSSVKPERISGSVSSSNDSRGNGGRRPQHTRYGGGSGQWKPALQSISELGT